VVKHLGGGDYLSVYVPTTPNPTGGYFVMLKRSDCIELKMSVDEALTYIDFDGGRGARRPLHGGGEVSPLNSKTNAPTRR
jgi:hypothetical protein